MVLIDTVVLSYALRRKEVDLNERERAMKFSLATLMETGQAQVIGPVRQELLSGIKDRTQFELVRDAMRTFPNIRLITRDFEEAARLSNICRENGISGAPTDLLLCAVALLRDWQILTADADFRLYSKHLPISLFTA